MPWPWWARASGLEETLRRYARTLILIAVLLAVAVTVLAVQKISVAGLERGGDTVLGLSLGLDLQGGIHLVYQVENVVATTTDEVTPLDADVMDGLKRIIERRVNSSGLGEPIVQILGEDRLLVQLPGVRDSARAEEIVGKTALLEFKHRRLDVPRRLDQFTPADVVSMTARRLPSEAELEAEFGTSTDEMAATTTEEMATSTEEEAESAAEEATSTEEAQPAEELPPVLVYEFTEDGAAKFQAVLDELIVGSISPTSPLPSRLEIAIDGDEPLRYTDAPWNYFQRLASSTSFAMALGPYADSGQDADALIASTNERLGPDPTASFTEIQGSFDDDIGLTGDDLDRAFPGTHSGSGVPIVNIEFDDNGTRIFGELTQQIVGTQEAIAIFLDEEELIAPVVSSVITSGTAYIQGNFTLERAQDIALLLESGRLPVPVELIQKRNIDATLGVDSLNRSVVAGLVGLGSGAAVHGALLPRARRCGRGVAAHLRIAAAGHFQDSARHAHLIGRRRGDTVDRYGRRCQHTDIRAYEGRDTRRTNAALGNQHRIRQGVAGNPGRQRIHADNVRHTVLVLGPAWHHYRTGIRGHAGHRRVAEHVLGHHGEQDTAESAGDDSRFPRSGRFRTNRRQRTAPAADARGRGVE